MSKAPDLPAASPLGQAALQYAALGLKVFPCRPRDKSPLTRHGCKDATTDATQIRQWWQRWPEANVAIATTGLIVVDTDGPGGEAAIITRELPPTPTARTAKGMHRFFIDTRGNARNGVQVLPEVDIRATGGYVIAAPSVHPSGAVYAWVEGLSPADLPMASAPDWVYELQATPPPAPAPQPAAAKIPRGQRNTTLTQLAGRLRADGADQATLEAALLEINAAQCNPPLSKAEVRRIAASVSRYPARVATPMVAASRSLLNSALPAGPVILYLARQAFFQRTGKHAKQAEQAEALGVATRTVKKWTAELRAAGMDRYTRPARRFIAVPACLLLDGRVPPEAKLTALHLLGYVDDRGVASVGLRTLAQRSGRSERSLKRDIQYLCQAQHVRVDRASFNAEQGRRERCNIYHFLAMAGPEPVGLSPQKGHTVARSQPPKTKLEPPKGHHVTPESKPFGAATSLAGRGTRAEGSLSPDQPNQPQGTPSARSARAPEAPTAEDRAVAEELAESTGIDVDHILTLIQRHGRHAIVELKDHRPPSVARNEAWLGPSGKKKCTAPTTSNQQCQVVVS